MLFLRSISWMVVAASLVGIAPRSATAQETTPPGTATPPSSFDSPANTSPTPVEADWFSVSPQSLKPIDLQAVAATTSAPNIADPGPDMGDFPNSAFTLPKGRIYIESAPFTYAGADAQNAAAYNWPFLFRYGVTDDVELRFLSNGGTSIYEDEPVTGIAPLIIDSKIHLWDGNGGWIPASSFEAYLMTPWGSSDFQTGWQPSLNMNFDLALTDTTNLEWSLGYSGVRDAIAVTTNERFIPRHQNTAEFIHIEGLNVYQFTVQWAVEQEVTDKITLFVHGYYAGAILLQQGAGTVIGGGGFYQFNNRWMAFFSCNAGLDDNVAPLSGQTGLAFAL